MTQGFDVRYPSHPRSYQDTTDAQEVFEDILETREVRPDRPEAVQESKTAEKKRDEIRDPVEKFRQNQRSKSEPSETLRSYQDTTDAQEIFEDILETREVRPGRSGAENRIAGNRS